VSQVADPAAHLRHELTNPLAALLIETQLLLQHADRYDAETVTSLKEIEAQARRMRDLLHAASR